MGSLRLLRIVFKFVNDLDLLLVLAWLWSGAMTSNY